MSEFTSKKPYSAAARKVTEIFTGSKENFSEYEQRGLIATNNLGLRMLVFESGPESELWQFYSGSLFTSKILERLERARAVAPELWQESLTAYEARSGLMSEYVSAIEGFGPNDSRTKEIRQQTVYAEQHDVELRTKIFEVIDQEPLSEEEAIELCR
jgi:hypothetical protein